MGNGMWQEWMTTLPAMHARISRSHWTHVPTSTSSCHNHCKFRSQHKNQNSVNNKGYSFTVMLKDFRERGAYESINGGSLQQVHPKKDATTGKWTLIKTADV
eukprot:5173797-Amphidinium_carterae.2